MVTCKLQGGISNNLFQMAQCIAHAKKHGFSYAIPTKIHNPHSIGQNPYISPNITYTREELDLPIYQEKSFEYEEIPPIDNVCFEGYWQSGLYFEDYREEILKALNFKWERNKDYCSIHIRLGDYLEWLDHHPPITKGYLFEAMMNIMTRVKDWEVVKFLVFSDSPNIAKEMLSSQEFKSFPIEYSNEENPARVLEQASSCSYNIGSNSAMSWWIYYLNQNPNKIGTLPRIWFGKAFQNNTKDLYPPNIIIL